MRSIVITIHIVLLLAVCVSSQESVHPEDKEMHELLSSANPFHCLEYSVNAMTLIPDMYERGAVDSINFVLDFWERKCGNNERLLQTKILLYAATEGINEALYDGIIAKHLLYERQRRRDVEEFGYGALAFLGSGRWPDIASRFDRFIESLANEVNVTQPENSLESLFAQFYLGRFDQFYGRLNSSSFSRTVLYRNYRDRIDYMVSNRGMQYHFALSGSVWIPTGGLEPFRRRFSPELKVGNRFGGVQVDLSIAYRRLSNADLLYSENKSGGDSTREFESLDIGGEFLFKVASIYGKELLLMGGMGVNMIIRSALSPQNGNKVVNAVIAVSGGAEYRSYLNRHKTWYLSLWSRITFPAATAVERLDISGTTISFGLKVGSFSYGQVRHDLELLNYFRDSNSKEIQPGRVASIATD